MGHGNALCVVLVCSACPRKFTTDHDPLAGYFKIGEHNEHWECGNPVGWIGNLTNIEYMSFSDPNGTSHAFPESGYESATVAPCVSGYSPLSSFSNDAAGYDLTTNSSGVVTSLIDKHGTHYTLGGNEGYGIVSAGEQNPNQPQNPIIGSTSLNFYPITKIEDSNGNTLASNTNGIIDTVGRTITETAGPPFASSSLMVEATGKQISKITYYDQNNQPQSITINYGSISIDLTQACNGALPALCGPQVGTSASTITVQLPTSIALQNGDEYQISYVPNSLGEVQSITLPTGGTISYTYSANPNDLAGSIGRQVTSRTVTANGQTSTWGFNGYIVTDPNSNDTVYTCNLGWPCYMTNEVIYKGSHTSGTPLVTRSTTYTQYGCAFLPTAEKFTWNASGQTTETDTTYDSFSAAQQFCEINNTYTSTTSRGNPYSRMIYDYGFGSHRSLLTNTQYSYWHDTHSNYVTANIVDRLSQVSIYNSTTISQSSLVAESTTAYDSFTSGGQTGLVATTGTTQHDYANYGTGTILRGLPTSVTKYTGPNTAAITTYVNYNDLGNETVSTDGLRNSTTYTYGGQNAFLASTTRPATNGVAHVTTENHDLNTGLLMLRKDENQNPTTYTYDSRMRPLSVSFPDLGSTTFAYPDPNHINTSVLMNSTQTNVLQEILDGLGRAQETIEATGISGQQIYTYTSYDALGRKSQQWNPTYCDPPTSNCSVSVRATHLFGSLIL